MTLCVAACARVMHCRMLENDAESFLQLSAVDNLVQQASVASTLLHNDAQASALRFLVALIDVADMETVNTARCLVHKPS